MNVSLKKNAFKEIEMFQFLPNLLLLDCSENKITSSEFLAANPGCLAYLTSINLSNNEIRELCDFPQSRLLRVNLNDNKILSCDKFQGDNNKMKFLYMERNRIKDLKWCHDMPCLEELSIAECAVTSLEGMHDLPCLKTLNVRANKIASLDNTPMLSSVETLILDENAIGEEDGVKQLPKL